VKISISNIFGLVLGLMAFAVAYPMIDGAIRMLVPISGDLVSWILRGIPAILLVIIISSAFEEEENIHEASIR